MVANFYKPNVTIVLCARIQVSYGSYGLHPTPPPKKVH